MKTVVSMLQPINADQIKPCLCEPKTFGRELLTWFAGETHAHSDESTRRGWNYFEGLYSPQEIAAYYGNLGCQFVCITDHSSKPGDPHAILLDPRIGRSLSLESTLISAFNRLPANGKRTFVFSGVEANILFGEQGPCLDIEPANTIINVLDLIIASRHKIAQEKVPRAIQASLLFAAENPSVCIIGHPDRYARRDDSTDDEYRREYQAIWPAILETMEKNGKAFEINLTSQPSKKLVKMASERKKLLFSIGFDAHDFRQFTQPISTEVERAKAAWAKGDDTHNETLIKYKLARLNQGPGLKVLSRLSRWVKFLKDCDVTRDRVVNSSLERFIRFLVERGRKTENIALIAERAGIHL